MWNMKVVTMSKSPNLGPEFGGTKAFLVLTVVQCVSLVIVGMNHVYL
jgi:hypothetical protein